MVMHARLTMIGRPSETERTMALQRLEEANQRIADLEAGIQRLKEKGKPTAEAECLLRLMRRSRVVISRVVMRRYVYLLAEDKT